MARPLNYRWFYFVPDHGGASVSSGNFKQLRQARPTKPLHFFLCVVSVSASESPSSRRSSTMFRPRVIMTAVRPVRFSSQAFAHPPPMAMWDSGKAALSSRTCKYFERVVALSVCPPHSLVCVPPHRVVPASAIVSHQVLCASRAPAAGQPPGSLQFDQGQGGG